MTTALEISPDDSGGPPRDATERLNVPDAAVTFSLSGISVEAGRKLVEAIHARRRQRVQAQIGADIDATRSAETRAEEALDDARAAAVAAAEYLRHKSAVEEMVRRLARIIRGKRHELEAKKIADELTRLDAERHATIERLAQERMLRHQTELDEWRQRAGERKDRVDELKVLRDETATAARELRTSSAARMNGWMSRTAAGFLIWAGYTVIGTTGIAVSSLLGNHSGRSLLTDIGTSAVKLMTELAGGAVHPLIAALGGLLAFLVSVTGVLVLIDLLMRWFDKRWLLVRSAREHASDRFTMPVKPELGRSTFAKLLIAIPLAYVAGSLVAFIAYGGTVASNGLLVGESTAVLHTLIGTALSLLSASMFVLYFSNILEPRTAARGSRWPMVWEIGIVPFVMVAAIGAAAWFGPESRWAWAGIITFMLLGSMALAYGLVYRGMYRQLDYVAHAIAEYDKRILQQQTAPQPDEPSRGEQREIARVMTDYRQRRQQLLDLDRERRLRRTFLTSDEGDTALIDAYHVASSRFWNVLVRLWRVKPQHDFYRVTDLEAAPRESEQRQQLEQELRDIDIELALLEPEETRKKVEELERTWEEARAARERAEREQSLRLALNDEQEVVEGLQYEKAYAMGTCTKPSYDAVTRRRDEAVGRTVRPRVPRPARNRAAEVSDGH